MRFLVTDTKRLNKALMRDTDSRDLHQTLRYSGYFLTGLKNHLKMCCHVSTAEKSTLLSLLGFFAGIILFYGIHDRSFQLKKTLGKVRAKSHHRFSRWTHPKTKQRTYSFSWTHRDSSAKAIHVPSRTGRKIR